MDNFLWFLAGILVGSGIATWLFFEYKTQTTLYMQKLEVKFERLVGIISGWQKDIKK
jgi:hypothetical protein